MSNTIFNNVTFDLPKSQSNAIKVIGVGGGGSNAVNHMFTSDVKGVDFVICNTDAQALQNSPIPNKIQLGAGLTSGLGAGANPDVGANAAKESIEEIELLLNSQTKMVFITAGMGGGTGTGAAPIIASIAKKLDILTVGIVTMPFQFEGRMRSKQAQKGIDELRSHVDSLIVINNNKLREVYGNLGFKAGFSKADEVLSTAAKSIAEVITHHYKQNIDLHDAKTVLSNSGTAIMGSAKASGESRSQNAIINALDSPLLNENKITGAKNVLLLIISGANEVTLDEIGEINDYIQQEAGFDANIIMGVGEDDALGEAIAVTIVATGFALDQQKDITNTEVKKVYHTLGTEQTAQYDFEESKAFTRKPRQRKLKSTLEEIQHVKKDEQKVVHQLFEENVSKEVSKLSAEEVIEEQEVEEIVEDDFVITDVTTPDLFSAITQETEEAPEEKQGVFDLPVEDVGNEDVVTNKELFDVSEIEIVDPETTVFERKNPTEEKKVFKLEEDPKEDVKETTENVGVVEDDLGIKRYTLNDSVENTNADAEFDAEFDLSMKMNLKGNPTNTKIKDIGNQEDVSPLNMSIDELKQKSVENRKKTLKSFNQRYKNASYNEEFIEDIEKQPAYKRLGVELHHKKEIDNKSGSTVEISEDNQLLIRKNNSFLHDNVD